MMRMREVNGQRPRDLDDLLLPQTQILHQGHRVDVFFELGHQCARLARLLGEVEPGLRAQLAAHEDVVANAEIRSQAQFLVDDRDAAVARVRGGGKGNEIAVENDLAGCRSHHAGQYLHQRRLARAILSEQGRDLAAMNVEVDAFERMNTAV